MRVITFDSRNEAVQTVERGEVEAGLLIPETFDADLQTGVPIAVELVRRSVDDAQGILGNVQSALTQQSIVLRAAGFVESEGVGSFAQGLEVAQVAGDDVADVTVTVTPGRRGGWRFSRWVASTPALSSRCCSLSSSLPWPPRRR